ncbi:putative G-patch domain, R3H domain-containing protein [Heracleum sosnowskyi]|uniref:G-patch domain, R3H domain-containing protein n=1 Tax=Heracleum sosnowskyi TaxID=360622 RepID=A0AAD8JJ47_9APIA|nr:putative G-patch domain, R3H domain-containing protein [Heracleum sosnowskyi]
MGGRRKRLIKSKRGRNSSPKFVQAGENLNNGKGTRNKDVSSTSKSKIHRFKGGKGNAFGYVYPAVDHQVEGSLLDVGKVNDESVDVSDPIVVVGSGKAQIFAYVDEAPLKEPQSLKNIYEPRAGLGLDNTSHRGLGFPEELETTPSDPKISLNFVPEEEPSEEESSLSSLSFEEVETDFTCVNELSEGDDLLARIPSKEKNSAYLSIGGLKVYTEDILSGESEDDDGEVSDGETMESFESVESSGLSETDGMSDTDSSIDEEVAEDYFEGIPGSERYVNADLLEGELCHVTDDVTSGGNDSDTMQKWGGNYLQDASREYGMEKPQSGRKYSAKPGTSGSGGYAWSSAMDDFRVAKGCRTVSGKKKHGSRFPQSWPSDAQKSKQFRRFPGKKKKLQKEIIAHKRCERMTRRGVDLEQINLKIRQMVLDGDDILSFHPMCSRDYSQVRRLAAIYGLQSGCQGSGKKRFVTVIRTERTCIPSSSGRVRLEKLIRAGDKDADFTVNVTTSFKGDEKLAKRGSKGLGQGYAPNKSFKISADRGGTKEVKGKEKSEDKHSYAAQPMSFVSSGTMHSESEIKTLNMTETDSTCHYKKDATSSPRYGAFELHTTGFGSKMMAKMGYMEGGGLGKDCQGRAEVIEVIQRPKSLGLGANVRETSVPSSVEGNQRPNKSSGSAAKGPKTGSKAPNKESQHFAAFEKHTKGFGSKMMARMGFVEGTGLGRDSQGIVNPLVASRLPKSRGLVFKRSYYIFSCSQISLPLLRFICFHFYFKI